MSYINPEWLENDYIERVMTKSNFDITDYQARCDNEIELVCLMNNLGASEIPTDEITEFTTSPMLMEFGIDYLTYLIARSKRQAGIENADNDVYDGIAKSYKEASDETKSEMTKELILNVGKEEISPESLSYADSFILY